MDCIAIIPARFSSTRFPGKLLASLAGRPLIQHVVEGARRIAAVDATVVATDDERIAEAARQAGADVVLSGREFASGTDRVADAATRFPAEIIVNVQGDELLLDDAAVDAALDGFRAAGAGLGTLRAPLTDPQDLWNPNVVKVVIDSQARALYFSRAPIPFPRGAWQAVATADGRAPWPPDVGSGEEVGAGVWIHLGVYLYRAEALRRWAALPPSRLEQTEGLEQLRALEAGETMLTYPVKEAIPGVNTPDDLERARAVFAARAARA